MQASKERCYYLDSVRGSDENDGRDPQHPLRTIGALNAARPASGDRVLLRGGHVFSGTLELHGSASASEDGGICIGSYGDGRATLYAGPADGVVLQGIGGLTLENLEIVGCGRNAGSDGTGITAVDCSDLSIHDVIVRGFRVAGIAIRGGSDIRVERATAHHNGAAGIQVNRGHDIARRIVIRDCLVHDNAGDPKRLDNHSGNGIVVGGLDECLIEYCRAWNNGYDMPRTGNGPVGIWGYAAHRLTIQYCISHDNKTSPGGMDGGGFDFDGGVTESVLQYNLSYNNHGSGYLLCQYPGAERWQHNRCRFNISINDGRTNHHAGIHFWAGDEGISDAEVSNNLVVNDRHAVTATHDIPGLVMRNNILVSEDSVIRGPLSTTVFEGNHLWSRRDAGVFENGPTLLHDLKSWQESGGDESATGGDPRVALPPTLADLPTEPRELARMPWGRLGADSPLRGKARGCDRGADDGGHDEQDSRDLYGTAFGALCSPGVDQAAEP